MHLFHPSLFLVLPSLYVTTPITVASQIPTPTTITPTPSASPFPPPSSPEFTSAILTTHNTYRAAHNATPLAYNTTLASFASRFLAGANLAQRDDAKTNGSPSWHWCSSGTLRHSGGPYGENLALGCSDVAGCVRLWGDEREDYDFSALSRGAWDGWSTETGHFTQVVWKATTDVGCAARDCMGGDGDGNESQGDKGGSPMRGWLLACEYWPRGNVIGRFAEEVQAPAGAESAAGLRLWGEAKGLWIIVVLAVVPVCEFLFLPL